MTFFETIVFPDATAVIIDHLTDTLPGFGSTVGVFADVPSPRPTSFVRVQRTGGPRATLVTDAAQVTLESWGSTSPAAADLAQLVRAVVLAMPGVTVGTVRVYRVDELSGPADLPDPVSDQRRYTQTVIVHLRGAAVTADVSV